MGGQGLGLLSGDLLLSPLEQRRLLDRSLGWSKCGPDRTGAGCVSSPDYRMHQSAWLSLIRRKNVEVEGGQAGEMRATAGVC